MKNLAVVCLAAIVLISGCGYTQKASLPRNIESIYVETVVNSIPLDKVYAYQPGLEIDITNSILRRLEQDGNLQVVPKDQADAILRSHLIGFEQSGVRFNQLERVEEFRMFVILAVQLIETKTNSVIWTEPKLSGTSEYFVSDVRSIAREEGAERAVKDLARNVVDRIVEDW